MKTTARVRCVCGLLVSDEQFIITTIINLFVLEVYEQKTRKNRQTVHRDLIKKYASEVKK